MRTTNNPLVKITLLSLALCFTSTAMAKIYKWTDANGKTHYTATPPPAKVKANTEEFKVQKVKKSSLSNNSYADDNSSGTNTGNKSAKTGANNAQDQCRKAIRKYPAVLSKLKRKLNQGKAAGKISDADYNTAMAEVQKEKNKIQSMSDCVKDYKRGGSDANSVNLIADNNAEDALAYLMLGAAFAQAEKDIAQKKK